MIQHDDLYRFYHPSDGKFDDEQTRQITSLADLHLIKCGYSGIIIIPLLYFIAGYVTNFFSEHTLLFFSVGAAVVIASLGRTHAALKIRKI